MRWTGSCQARDRGSAVVDFVLVGTLATLVFASLLQFVVILHVKNVLVDCAEQGARFGALADQNPEAGAGRTRELISAELSTRYAGQVSAGEAQVQGLTTVEVRVKAPLPVVGLLAAGRVLTVSGHALAEPP
jgi:hypothetical protein